MYTSSERRREYRTVRRGSTSQGLGAVDTRYVAVITRFEIE